MNTSLLTALSLVSRVPRMAAKSGAAKLAALGGGATGLRPDTLSRAARGQSGLFSVNNSDVTRQKIRLMERVGKELGVEMNDFNDMRSFGRAVREQMSKLDPVTLKVMEVKLGLTKLGVTMLDMVEAMEDPGGTADDKLEAALRKELGKQDDDDGRKSPVSVDDIGRYRPSGAAKRNR